MDKVVTKILCCRNLLIHCPHHHHHHQRNMFKQFIRPLQETDIAGRNSSQFRQCHDDTASKDSLQDKSGKVKRGKHEGGQDIGDNKLSTKRRSLESESSVNHKGNIKDNFFEDVTTTSSTIAAKSIKSPGSDTSNCSTSSSSSSCVSSSSCDSTSSSSSSSTKNKNNSLNDSSGKRLPSSDEKLIKKEPPVAPDPETCCESGCVNCVWIKYAEEVKDYYPDHEEKLKEILDMIEDYNVKMFVRMELGMKK